MTATKEDFVDSVPVAWRGSVEGIKVEVCVKEITGADFDFILSNNAKGEPDERLMLARHVVGGICDETGELLYSHNQVSEVNKNMSLRKLKALCALVQEHSGMCDEKEKDESGNSKTTTSNASGTD